jgi:hypothetical protein
MTIDSFLNLHAALGDFDQDGRVDIFSSRMNSELGPQTQVLYWAEANGSYTRVFSSVFAKQDALRGLGTSIGDFDGDGIMPTAGLCRVGRSSSRPGWLARLLCAA